MENTIFHESPIRIESFSSVIMFDSSIRFIRSLINSIFVLIILHPHDGIDIIWIEQMVRSFRTNRFESRCTLMSIHLYVFTNKSVKTLIEFWNRKVSKISKQKGIYRFYQILSNGSTRIMWTYMYIVHIIFTFHVRVCAWHVVMDNQQNADEKCSGLEYICGCLQIPCKANRMKKSCMDGMQYYKATVCPSVNEWKTIWSAPEQWVLG